MQVNESGDPRDSQVRRWARAARSSKQIDFRYERGEKTGLEIKPGDKLFLAVKAADKFDLAGEPHVASGDRYQLDVVTPEELLAHARSPRGRPAAAVRADHRRNDADARFAAAGQGEPARPARRAAPSPRTSRATTIPTASSSRPSKRRSASAELRLLRVQRAMQQSQKSVAEVLGVAAGFLDIREELINNRVDTEDRKNRLKEQIADPLEQDLCRGVSACSTSGWRRLETLLREAGVAVANRPRPAPLADEAIDQANIVLAQLEAVLAKMQDLETYNELLEIVRDLLKDQEKLIERTQQERKRQTLEDLK